MSSLNATTLSDEIIASVRASLASVKSLQDAMLTAAQANDDIGDDEGTGMLYRIIGNVRGQFAEDLDKSDAKASMPAEIVAALSEQIAPCLAEVVVELRQLWDDVEAAVENGNEGEELVNEFLENADEDDSPLARLTVGLEKVQEVAEAAALDALANAFS